LNASRAGWVTKASKVGLIVNASAGQLSANDATPASNKEARLVLARLVLGIAAARSFRSIAVSPKVQSRKSKDRNFYATPKISRLFKRLKIVR